MAMTTTIRTLLRKELRALLPFIWLLLVLLFVDLVYLCITEFPDSYGIVHWDDGVDIGSHCILLAIIAFTLGQGLLMRERAEDTLEFLDALPVTRTQVFFSKFFVGWSLLSLWVLVDAALYFALHWWATDSHNPELFPQFWLARVFILLWMTFVYLSIGVAASFVGRFGLIVIAFLILAVFYLKQQGDPMAELLDPFAAGTLQLDGTSVLLPWKILKVQMAVGGACLLVALICFLRLAMPRSSGGFLSKAAMPVFVIVCILFAGAWIAYLAIYTMNDETVAAEDASAESVAEPLYPDYQTTRARSGDFVFIYPNNAAKRAETLIAESARVHDTVVDFLHADRRSDLVVDLTSNSPRHAGIAFWKRIRMNLDAGATAEELAAILGHELTHVYIDQLSENRLSDRFNSTRFFHEGLASYIEYRFFRKPEAIAEIRRIAAAAYDRDQVRFEDLVSSSTLSSRYTSEWVYPLGEVFASAVVERFGDDAPQKLVRAFARVDAPQGLNSMPLWQDTFQSCGYNLEEAISAFFGQLEHDTNVTYRDWLDKLPRLSGELLRDDEGEWIGVRIRRHTEHPGADLDPENLVCRFRSTATSADSEYLVAHAGEDGIAWTDADNFQRGGFWYQIGYYEKDELFFPIYDPWVRGRLNERK